jgi:hypothetical protein
VECPAHANLVKPTKREATHHLFYPTQYVTLLNTSGSNSFGSFRPNMGDHYLTTACRTNRLDNVQVVTIFSRNCKNAIGTTRIPKACKIGQIYGKWALLFEISDSRNHPQYPFYGKLIRNITVTSVVNNV